MNYLRTLSLFFFTVFVIPISAIAENVTIDFEGLKDLERVENFYNGGTGSLGSEGPDYGITFNAETLSIIDIDEGGSGNIANEKEPGNTVGFFLDSDKIIMNVENGFTGGFSFWYSSLNDEGNVLVYPNPDGQGNVIETLNLEALGSTPNGGDPNGEYNKWVKKTVSFNGTAKSIVFQGVANRIAFDLITLSSNPPFSGFDISYQLDKIVHTPSSNLSDVFSIHFNNVKSEKDENGDDKENIAALCDTYIFKVEKDILAPEAQGATQTNCALSDDNELTLDFAIRKTDGNKAFFEKNKVYVCQRDNEEVCKEIDIISDFSVYGSSFDIEKHAFSYYNGGWTQYYLDQIKKDPAFLLWTEYTGVMNNMRKGFQHYLNGKNADVAARLIGYQVDRFSIYNLFKEEKGFNGICHGMALSSIANYNNTGASWGDEINKSTSESRFITLFGQHWDNRETEPARPLKDDAFTYQVSNLDQFTNALSKNIYYYLSQPPSARGDKWVGEYTFAPVSLTEKQAELIEQLKAGKVGSFIFFLEKGAHSIVSTQIISYNNHKNMYFYDNNFPNTLTALSIENNKHNSVFYFDRKATPTAINFDKLSFSYGTIKAYKTMTNDPLSVYGASAAKRKASLAAKEGDEANYPYPNHIKVHLVGGKFLGVTRNGEEITLKNKFDTVLDKDSAYSENTNIFTNYVYLPKNSIYRISIEKDEAFTNMDVYTKIPNDDGTVNVINYSDVQIDKNDATRAQFSVGNGNTDKQMTRTGASEINPSHDEVYPITLKTIEKPSLIILTDKIQLQWTNPVNPRFAEVVLIKKENEQPTSITDGVEIYRGSDEEYVDAEIANNKKYHYALYTLAKDGIATEPRYLFIDTSRYTLYGTLNDSQGNPAQDVRVTLKAIDKTSIIDVTSTDNKGLYTFNELTNGTYYISFEHDSYTFPDTETEVVISDNSLEVTVDVLEKQILTINANPVPRIDETEAIMWNGQHIADTESVNVERFRNGQWEAIATNIAFNQYAVDWKITEPEGDTKVRVVLVSDTEVLAEKDIVIIKAKTIIAGNTTPDDSENTTNTNSGGSGSMDGLLILLFLSLLFARRLKLSSI